MLEVKLQVSSALMADYMAYLFPADGEGQLKVSAGSALGRLLVAHCRPAAFPPPEPEGGNVVSLVLPNDEATKPLWGKFLHYTPSSAAALNMALSAVFDIDFRLYYARLLELAELVLAKVSEDCSSGGCTLLLGLSLESAQVTPEASLFGGWRGWSLELSLR